MDGQDNVGTECIGFRDGQDEMTELSGEKKQIQNPVGMIYWEPPAFSRELDKGGKKCHRNPGRCLLSVLAPCAHTAKKDNCLNRMYRI